MGRRGVSEGADYTASVRGCGWVRLLTVVQVGAAFELWIWYGCVWAFLSCKVSKGGCSLWVVNSVRVCVAFLSCKVSKGGCGLWGVKSVWVGVAFEKSVWVGVTFGVKSQYGWKASEVWGQYLWVWPLRCEVSICGCDLWGVKSLFVGVTFEVWSQYSWVWPLRCEVSNGGCGLWGEKSVRVGVASEVRSQ